MRIAPLETNMSVAIPFFQSLVRRNLSLLLFVLLVTLSPSTLRAQIVETGIITGVVQDNTGSVISNAQVTVRNAGTGLANNSITDAQGLYVSPPLKPGDYTVEISVPGFKKVVETVRLEVGQRVSANATLALGETSETIEVQATGELLETESSSVSNLRSEEAVKNLPLNGRNFAELVGLGAGTVPAETQIASVPYTMQRGETSFSFNGLRYQENRLLLDGIGNNDNHNGLGVVIFPPIDAIQEFSEDIADADARYGRGNGGTINLVFKSGTNHYHGEVFEFLRNTALDARNYFVPAPNPKGVLRENQFGATFGGPLFPKHTDPKTFFFADYAGSRLAQGQVDTDNVPNFSIANGYYNFSAYSPIHNPATGIVYPLVNGLANQIPTTDPNIDPTGAKVLAFYQQYAPSNAPSAPGAATSSNFLYTPLRIDNGDAFDVKVDHKFSDKDSGFFRYSQSEDTLNIPGLLPAPLVGGTIVGPAKDPAHQFVASETHIFSPTTINTVRFGWSRLFVNARNFDNGLNLPQTLGIPGVDLADPRSDGLPAFGFGTYTGIGDAGNSPSQIGTNNYQTDDNINWVHGKHSVDIGFEFVRLQYNMFQTGAEHGSATYGTTYSGVTWTDLLFGAPTNGSYSFPTGTVGLRQSDLSFYVQDNYKFNNRLTLNFGIRYENILGWPWTEVNNKEYDFVPSISTTALEQVGTNGIARSGLSGNNLDFAPRVGFAYSITNKTVFHAGYGIYYSSPNVTNSSGLSANIPVDNYWAFNNNTTYGAPTTSNNTPFVFTKSGFNSTPVTSVNPVPANTSAFAQDPNAKTPYSEQWHATIEQQIPFSTVLKFAYVGTKGVHLDNTRNINTNQLGSVIGGTLVTNVTNTKGVSTPYPQFGTITDVETRQISNYNALQVTAERRAHGLGLLASYTYSHALDESTGSPGSVTNPYNLRFDYGNSDMDVPNRFVASATYELPFKGAGKLGTLERGWQLNTILQYYDGFPFTVASSSNGTGLSAHAVLLPGFGNGSFPTNQRHHNLSNGTSTGTWFNPAAFSPAPAVTLTNGGLNSLGNIGRNSLQGPGTRDVDFSVFKNTTLHESKVLQLRAEFFNLFNTPQFNNPASTYVAPTVGANGLPNYGSFGKVSSAGNEPLFQRLERQIQLAAKITF
jgi:hypothetical protein